MKNIVLPAVTLLLCTTTIAQVKNGDEFDRRTRAKAKMDTIFYNENGRQCEPEIAEEYATIWKSEGSYFNYERFSLPKHILKSKGQYLNVDSAYKLGPFFEYYPSGNLSTKGTYARNMHSGLWTHYLDSSQPIIWYTCRYQRFDLFDTLKSYYPNGKLKRCEVHQSIIVAKEAKQTAGGIDTVAESKDSIIYGLCYDSLGKERPFTPFNMMPQSPYNVSEYFSENLSYPKSARKKGIEGKVHVRFVVNRDGHISDVHVSKHASPRLDEEARRVIADMPPWRPGLKDDVPVKVRYTVPITFELED